MMNHHDPSCMYMSCMYMIVYACICMYIFICMYMLVMLSECPSSLRVFVVHELGFQSRIASFLGSPKYHSSSICRAKLPESFFDDVYQGDQLMSLHNLENVEQCWALSCRRSEVHFTPWTNRPTRCYSYNPTGHWDSNVVHCSLVSLVFGVCM